MPFGLGFLELLTVLLLYAAPIALVVVAFRVFASRSRSGGVLSEQRRLVAELESTRSRVAALEERLASAEEKLEFNQRLLEAKIADR